MVNKNRDMFNMSSQISYIPSLTLFYKLKLID